MIRQSKHSGQGQKTHRSGSNHLKNNCSNQQIYYNQNTFKFPLGKLSKKNQSAKNSKTKTKSKCSKKSKKQSLSREKLDLRKRNKSSTKQEKTAKQINECIQKGLKTPNKQKQTKNKNSQSRPKRKLVSSSQKLRLQRNIQQFQSQYGSIEIIPKVLRQKRSQTCFSKDKTKETFNQSIEKAEIIEEPLGMRSPLPVFWRVGTRDIRLIRQIRTVGNNE